MKGCIGVIYPLNINLTVIFQFISSFTEKYIIFRKRQTAFIVKSVDVHIELKMSVINMLLDIIKIIVLWTDGCMKIQNFINMSAQNMIHAKSILKRHIRLENI